MLRKLYSTVGALLPGDMLGASSSSEDKSTEISAKTGIYFSSRMFPPLSTALKLTTILSFLKSASAESTDRYFKTPDETHLLAVFTSHGKMPFYEVVESVMEKLKAGGITSDAISRSPGALIDTFKCYKPYVIDLYYSVARNASDILTARGNVTSTVRDEFFKNITNLVNHIEQNQTLLNGIDQISKNLTWVMNTLRNCNKKHESSSPLLMWVFIACAAVGLLMLAAHCIEEYRSNPSQNRQEVEVKVESSKETETPLYSPLRG